MADREFIDVRVIAFQEADGMWTAQCLEYDIAAQAGTLPDLARELQRVLVSHFAISGEMGQEPFFGLPSAPDKFWRMYEEAEMLVEQEIGKSDPLPYRVAPRLKIAEQRAHC